MMKRLLIEIDSRHIRVCGLVGDADVQVDDIREYDNALDASLEVEAELEQAAHETGLDDPKLRGPRKKYKTRHSPAATGPRVETINPRGANVDNGEGGPR